jgi:acyl carrier protein
MSRAKVIREFVVSTFLFGDAGSLQDDTSFMNGGIIDSTGILELVAFLETTYKISVDPGDLIPDNLDSVDKLTQFLARKLGEATAGKTVAT